jgi:protein gp37
MSTTKIEWTDLVWNPVTGCSKVSEGCRNCYAESLARRFNKDFKSWTAPNAAQNVRLHPERLEQPLHWLRPRMVFVNSMSDLFHEQIDPLFIGRILNVIEKASQHTFQVLTKRPKRMKEVLMAFYETMNKEPFPNFWLGISAEDQPTFDERVAELLATPAALRFVSCEPMLGLVDINDGMNCDDKTCEACGGHGGINWVIVGGESGPGSRAMNPEWVRLIRDQCIASDVPFWFKQWGGVQKWRNGRELDGRTWEEMPGQ